jgi:uncharacterized coiled-coil DUF342 family protein
LGERDKLVLMKNSIHQARVDIMAEIKEKKEKIDKLETKIYDLRNEIARLEAKAGGLEVIETMFKEDIAKLKE